MPWRHCVSPRRRRARPGGAGGGRMGRRHRVVGVGQCACDLPLVEVCRTQLDVAAVGLEPLVVLGRDPVAEHVHRLGLAAEASGELLGDEHVRPVGDLEDARDRVVIGDRHEVHAPPLGPLVDLIRRRRALGQAHGALHSELGDLGGRRVAMHVHPCGLRSTCRRHSVTAHSTQNSLQSAFFCDQAGMIVLSRCEVGEPTRPGSCSRR